MRAAVQILDRREEDTADLVELGERFAARLLRAVGEGSPTRRP